MKRRLVAASLALFSVAAPATAFAESAPTAGHVQVGALAGYGFKDGVNFGLGARGGYTLPMNVYLGGTFQYHFGKSEGPVSVNVYYAGVEGGYDIAIDPIVVRPYVGLGPAFGHSSGSLCLGDLGCQDLSDTKTKLGVWPGVTVLAPIQNFYVGADARFLIVDDFNAFSLFGTGGVMF
jgi:hypothetical protein